MKPYTESDLAWAVEAVQRGRSVRKAALDWGVPRTTLQDRLHGAIPMRQAKAGTQRLSPTLEDRLENWVLTQAAAALPPTHAELRFIAEEILSRQGDPVKLGKRWVTNSMKRYPSLKSQKARKIGFQRLNGATTEGIKNWWPRLHLPEIEVIKPENRWNVDEAGIMEGIGGNGIVLDASHARALQRKAPGTRAWTSFIECISATGRHLPPLVIFKGSSVQQQWFPTELTGMEDWKFTATKNGWTNNETAEHWLKEVFLPATKPAPGERRLLLLDGHASHVSMQFMSLCIKNNVQCVYLPAHAFHVLQPLDLGVFSSLKRAYRTGIDHQGQFYASTVIEKRLFLQTYREARDIALTHSNIASGFKATGMWPVNMAKPLMSRLLLENEDQRRVTRFGNSLNGAPDPPARSSFIEETSAVVWTTPTKATEVATQMREMGTHYGNNSTTRLLFSKLQKAMDRKDYDLAILDHENRILQARIESLQPQIRKKVNPDPNAAFATVAEVHRAQAEVGRVGIASEDDGDASDEESIEEEIVALG